MLRMEGTQITLMQQISTDYDSFSFYEILIEILILS